MKNMYNGIYASGANPPFGKDLARKLKIDCTKMKSIYALSL